MRAERCAEGGGPCAAAEAAWSREAAEGIPFAHSK